LVLRSSPTVTKKVVGVFVRFRAPLHLSLWVGRIHSGDGGVHICQVDTPVIAPSIQSHAGVSVLRLS
jgi:hypothetical protein